MLISIQLDDQFISVTPQNKPQLVKELRNKELIVFNAPFEQTQLYRQGFDIWSNKWVDVSLLAKLSDNRLTEEKIESLEEMEEHFLKTTSKKDKVKLLNAKYGGANQSFFKHPNIAEDPLFLAYGVNDTKITNQLYNVLQTKVDPKLFQALQKLQDKVSQWQMEGIPFPRVKISAARDRLAAKRKVNLERVVDLRVGQKTKSGLKGWNSSKLVTIYIKTHKPEWIPYLKPTNSGQNLCFSREAIELLMENFPNDKIYKLSIVSNAKRLSFYNILNCSSMLTKINSTLIIWCWEPLQEDSLLGNLNSKIDFLLNNICYFQI